MNNLYLLFALLTGAGVAVQSVINARLRVLLDGPFWAAAVQVIVALVFLLVLTLLTRQPAPVLSGIARAPLWIWTGGLFGAMFVLATIILTPKLGATLTLAMMIVGQLTGALVVDHYGLFSGTIVRLSTLRVLGVALLLLGVWLIRWK
ncbi:MAG TPA: DMT family transporter [Vicinamibacterales bacterium]|jgi:bacterial/archaeal transporter family-2 protein|nr:DMT family transporter [Vicinamibacterales bacterium]